MPELSQNDIDQVVAKINANNVLEAPTDYWCMIRAIKEIHRAGLAAYGPPVFPIYKPEHIATVHDPEGPQDAEQDAPAPEVPVDPGTAADDGRIAWAGIRGWGRNFFQGMKAAAKGDQEESERLFTEAQIEVENAKNTIEHNRADREAAGLIDRLKENDRVYEAAGYRYAKQVQDHYQAALTRILDDHDSFVMVDGEGAYRDLKGNILISLEEQERLYEEAKKSLAPFAPGMLITVKGKIDPEDAQKLREQFSSVATTAARFDVPPMVLRPTFPEYKPGQVGFKETTDGVLKIVYEDGTEELFEAESDTAKTLDDILHVDPLADTPFPPEDDHDADEPTMTALEYVNEQIARAMSIPSAAIGAAGQPSPTIFPTGGYAAMLVAAADPNARQHIMIRKDGKWEPMFPKPERPEPTSLPDPFINEAQERKDRRARARRLRAAAREARRNR